MIFSALLSRLNGRLERLLITLIAKKYLAWAVSIWLFVAFVGVNGWEAWLLFTASIFAIDAYTKAKSHVVDDTGKK